jgi:hypothetical protein
VQGSNLAQLHDAVKQQFLKLSDQERKVHQALTKMESTLAGSLAEFSHER